MVIMILETVPPRLRGQLTRWLIEPHTGVFIGHVNGMVRDRLWEKCCAARGAGGIIQAWSTNNEQRCQIRMYGQTDRLLVEAEGLQLICIPEDEPETPDPARFLT